MARFGFRDQLFDELPADLAETIVAGASELGLRDVHVSTVRALQKAVVIQATTDTPAETVRKLAGIPVFDVLLNGRAARFEGAFLGLVDASGEPVVETGTAARGLTGVFWVRPDLGVGVRGELLDPR